MECLRAQGHACHFPAFINKRLPHAGDISSSTNAGPDPGSGLQSRVETRRTMALTKEQSLCEVIAREEAQLAELADKHNETQERLAALKAELAAMESTPIVPSAPAMQPGADIPTTAEGKIQASRYLVIDFGTSQSPKSTRQRDCHYAPAALRPCRFATPSQARRRLRSTPTNGSTALGCKGLWRLARRPCLTAWRLTGTTGLGLRPSMAGSDGCRI